MSSPVLKKCFNGAIFVKGADGVLQMLGGALLYHVKPGTLYQAVVLLTQRELSKDPRDWLALHLITATQKLGDAKTFAVVYLGTQGFIKILLAASLLRGVLWAYPAMIGYLLVFIGYQLYRYSISHALGWLLLTVFDAGVAWLTWREYRMFLQERGSTGVGF